MVEDGLTRSLLDVLLPLLRRLNAERSVSAGKLGALRYLSEHGPATVSELAAAGHVSPQGMSLAVRELEVLRFVARLPDTEDRRRVWIQITDAGQGKLVQELAAGYGWLERSVSRQLTPQERAVLEAAVPVLRKLAAATDD